MTAATLRAIACTALGVLLTASTAAVAGNGPPQAPSVVVLISVDTLRADSVSFDGHTPQTTPFMDRLARDGVVFTQAYSTSSWTPPAMGSLLTGLYPTSHGVTTGNIQHLGRIVQPPLPEALTTLAEVFRKAGYTTIGVPANRHLMASLGFGQGFDYYFGEAAFRPAPGVNGEVRRQLEKAFGPLWRVRWKQGKVFLWIHYFDPHDPYRPNRRWLDRYAPEYRKNPAAFPANIVMKDLHERFPHPDAVVAARIRPLYEGEVAFWDQQFSLLARELGLDADNVLLAFTADHGEEIAEHGDLGHSQSLHEELVRVPLLVHWPDGLPRGKRISAPASLIDVYPTLVKLAGLEVPSAIQGHSLVTEMRGKKPDPERPVFMELLPPKPHLLAMRAGEWKLIRSLDPGGTASLYNLSTDPGEHHDIAAAHGALVRSLQRRLAAWYKSLPPAPQQAPVPLTDKKLEQQLRSLGYID